MSLGAISSSMAFAPGFPIMIVLVPMADGSGQPIAEGYVSAATALPVFVQLIDPWIGRRGRIGLRPLKLQAPSLVAHGLSLSAHPCQCG